MTAIIIFSAVVLIALYVAVIFVPSMFFYKRGYTAEMLAGKQIVAHRGGAKLAPENSLLAIEKGIQRDFPGRDRCSSRKQRGSGENQTALY